MKYQKNEILKKCGAVVVLGMLTVGVLVWFVSNIVNSNGVASIIVSLMLMGCCGFTLWGISGSLAETVAQYKAVKASGLLELLETINPYATYGEMLSAAKQEKQNKLYEDNEICITDSFLCSGNYVMLIDGILDASIIIHKTNGITDKVELAVLYYDGEKTSFDYDRTAFFSGNAIMQEQANQLEIAINLIARKSKLFRKYDCCRL